MIEKLYDEPESYYKRHLPQEYDAIAFVIVLDVAQHAPVVAAVCTGLYAREVLAPGTATQLASSFQVQLTTPATSSAMAT